MRTRRPQTEYIASPLDSVGGHPALNFINTLHMVGGELTDAWQSDEDVAAWIVREELRDTLPTTPWTGSALLGKARNLRGIARKAVEARKANKTLRGPGGSPGSPKESPTREAEAFTSDAYRHRQVRA